MAWTITSEADNAIILEISKQTDRGAALIATAYLDERLTNAIKSRLIRDRTLENTLFKGGGPLASLSTRINMGFLLGIYEKDIRRFLHTVKDVRNAFAHRPEPMNFKTQKIKDLCSNIDISVQAKMHIKAPDGSDYDIDFNVKSDGTPRTAFFNMTMYLLLILDMEINVAPPRVPAPPVFQSLAKPFLASNEKPSKPPPRRAQTGNRKTKKPKPPPRSSRE